MANDYCHLTARTELNTFFFESSLPFSEDPVPHRHHPRVPDGQCMENVGVAPCETSSRGLDTGVLVDLEKKLFDDSLLF